MSKWPEGEHAPGTVVIKDCDDPNGSYWLMGFDGVWHEFNPDGTPFIDVANIGKQTLSIRADLCVVSGGVATFPNSPLNTLIAAARTLCDNVKDNRISTEHLDKLRQALDGI